MSLIPSTMGIPQGFKPKSFWERPEGGAGKGTIYALIAAGGVALIYFWGQVVPYVLTTLQDTVMACVYGGILVVAAMTAFSIPPFGMLHEVIKNAFQSFSRGLARCYTTVDPIGILRNDLADMKQEKQTLDSTVREFSGSEEQLKRKIADKMQQAKQAYAESQIAAQKAASATNDQERLTLQEASKTDAEKAGLLLTGVQTLQGLEQDTSHLLKTFQQWSVLADAKIQRTEFKVDFLAEQRDIILSAKKTLTLGERLLNKKSERQQMVDMAIEFMEQDTANTLGQIREFSRITDKMKTDNDIESSANAELARQQFQEFSQKLLEAGSAPAAADFIQIPGVSNPAPVPVARAASAGASKQDDFDPFK